MSFTVIPGYISYAIVILELQHLYGFYASVRGVIKLINCEAETLQAFLLFITIF